MTSTTPSVYGSARIATSSVFDVITATADTLSSTVRTGSKLVGCLDERANLFADDVHNYCVLEGEIQRNRETLAAAKRHTEQMEEMHSYLYPHDKTFNREAVFNEALARLEALFKKEHNQK